MFGLSIQARDGASIEELNKAISQMMWMWDANKLIASGLTCS